VFTFLRIVLILSFVFNRPSFHIQDYPRITVIIKMWMEILLVIFFVDGKQF